MLSDPLMAKRLDNDKGERAATPSDAARDKSENSAIEAFDGNTAPSIPRFPVVGLVASAGGLDALKSFFSAMPSQSGMAFIVVPHLDSKHKSLMVDLLSHHTTMRVVEATDGQKLEPNSVFVIPPNHFLSLSHSQLQLSDLPEPIGSQTAIDFFLRSLAEDREELAIGIVLSGTGTHGTQGVREIKRCGGMAMAQSPDSSGFAQMPKSAIQTGLIDFVLTPTEMPETLLRYAQQPYLQADHDKIASAANASEQLKTILELARSRTKYDFRNYRTNMLLRRVERRMGLVQIDDLGRYLELLIQCPAELEALCSDFLIGVTAFFREPEAFAFLEKELFPTLVTKHDEVRPFRVWVPSCATGEEAYSIAILLSEAFSAAHKPVNIQVFASDINQQAIDTARRGVYPASITCDVPAAKLKQFFLSYEEDCFQVRKSLRESIIFSKQNLLSDAPFSKIDLICCRNLLIYLKPEIQQKLISLFHYSLVENGHLFLGSAETIGRATNLFEPLSKKWRIYHRLGTATPSSITLPIEKWENPPLGRALEHRTTLPRKIHKEITERNLLDYTPAAALINRNFEVLYVNGTMGDYLEFPKGELSKDLLAMARPGLRTRIRATCQSALNQRIEVSDNNAQVKRDGDYFACTISARPIFELDSPEPMILVVFRDHPKPRKSQSRRADGELHDKNAPQDDGPTLVQLLEYELKSTREELQNTIEEMENANEELQSSNEELGSAKEELQSLNEELSTVNCQLLEKVGELDKSNSEILNLMASTEIATLYLDRQLRIKRFTRPTIPLFNLLPTDEGRSIRDFASQIGNDRLFEDCLHVLDKDEPIEREVYTADNSCFLRRILPFRTLDQVLEGVVVTFIDLTARNRAEAEQKERDACFKEIFSHAATGIAIAGLDKIFLKCNPAFCKLVGYTETELHQLDFLSLIHPDDRTRNQEALQNLKAGNVLSVDIDNRYLHKNGSIISVRKFVSMLPDASGQPALYLALVTDVSTQLKTLEALKQSEERIRTILKTASDAIITIDNRGRIDSVNRSTELIFGYENSEIVGQNVSILMPEPFCREHDSYIHRFLATGEPRIIGTGREVICRRKNGTTFPADLAVSQVDHLGLFTGILRDVSSRKEMQKHIIEIAAMEQRRIGLELHDGTQQELTGLSLFASTLLDCIKIATPTGKEGVSSWQFDAASYARLRDTATLLAKRLAETNEHVRDLAHGIMPVQIDAEGLRSALVELANTVNSHVNIECTFECVGELTVPNNTVATHLYRIAQEAVNNAIRHSAASKITILLSLLSDRIVLQVSDNGSGFDNNLINSDGSSAKGMGMRTMEYRANLIGGRVQFLRGTKGGTVMNCEILKGGQI